MELKYFVILLIFFPPSVIATTAIYFNNEEFTLFTKKSILEKITGDPFDTTVIPTNLIPYAKDKPLSSGHYVLEKPLYSNEILILADGPYYATVWREGTAIQSELKALSSLLNDVNTTKMLQEKNYQIIRLDVYTNLTKEGESNKVYVYQNPGFRITSQDCPAQLKLVQTTGYKGSAFYCENNELFYIPSYSHKV